MRKLMVAAMMVLGTSAAFAGDSAPLKAILKANAYAEAEALINQNLSQLASNEEKAKAYNHLVNLAMKKVDSEQNVIAKNELAAQMKGQQEAFDTTGFYNSVYLATKAALECDKYDNMPNEKGKVKTKFRDANYNRLVNLRPHLINGGQFAAQKKNETDAMNCYGLYVETSDADLFKKAKADNKRDEYLGEVARVASIFAYQNKQMDLANRYCDVALADTATFNAALDLKMVFMQQDLATRADSLKAVGQMKELYAKLNENESVFSGLANMYTGLGDDAALTALIKDKLANNPNSYNAWIYKGQREMNKALYNDAIVSYKKALDVKSDDALIFTFLAFCINAKAADVQAKAEQKALYTESATYLEKARELDPQRGRANWSYPLYQCYYFLYGEADSRTQEMYKLNNQK